LTVSEPTLAAPLDVSEATLAAPLDVSEPTLAAPLDVSEPTLAAPLDVSEPTVAAPLDVSVERLPQERLPLTASVCTVVLSGRFSVGALLQDASCTTFNGVANSCTSVVAHCDPTLTSF